MVVVVYALADVVLRAAQAKRQVFPAFFRLSNYELSVLLSRARDAGAIQPFLHQCFENVQRIVFGTRDAFQEIQSVRAAACVEVVTMGKNLKARGPPEQWLAAVDKRLAEQLRRTTKDLVGVLAGIASTVSAPTASAGTLRSIDSAPIQVLKSTEHCVLRCVMPRSLTSVSPVLASASCSRIGSRDASWST